MEFTVAWLVFMSMPQQPHAAFEACVCHKLCTMYAESDSCVRQGMRLQFILRAAELTGLSSFIDNIPYHWSKFCKWKVYVLSSVGGGPNFSEGVHILQQNKLQGVLIYRKISSGGTNFGGSIFTTTGHLSKSTISKSTHEINSRHSELISLALNASGTQGIQS